MCLPYSSVVPALMDFIRFSRGWVLPFCQGGAAFAFLLPCAGFGCAPAGLRHVRERGFWVPYGYSRCVPFFFQINPGCGSEGVFPWALLLTNLYMFLQVGFIWVVVYFAAAAYINTRLLKKVFAPYMEQEEEA